MVCECECVYVCVARESVCGESGIVRDRPVMVSGWAVDMREMRQSDYAVGVYAHLWV